MPQLPTSVKQPVDQLTFREWSKILSKTVSAAIESNVKRRFRRYAVSGETRGEYQYDDQQFKRSWPLLEVSAHGLTLKSHEELPSGAMLKIQVNFDGNWYPLRGRIVHSTCCLGGFKVGIKLIFPDG